MTIHDGTKLRPLDEAEQARAIDEIVRFAEAVAVNHSHTQGGRDVVSPEDRLRHICLGLPEAQERLSHGHPTYFVGEGLRR